METNTLFKKYVCIPTEVEAVRYDDTEEMAEQISALTSSIQIEFDESGFCGMFSDGVGYLKEGDYVVHDLNDNSFYVLTAEQFEKEFAPVHAEDDPDNIPTDSHSHTISAFADWLRAGGDNTTNGHTCCYGKKGE